MSLSRLPQETKQHISAYLSTKSARNLSLAQKGTYVTPTYDQCCMRFTEYDLARLAFTIPDLRNLINSEDHNLMFSRRMIGGKTVFLYLPIGPNGQTHIQKDVTKVEIIETPGELVKAWHKAHDIDNVILIPRESMETKLMRFVIPILKRRTNCRTPGWLFKCWKSILRDWITMIPTIDGYAQVLFNIFNYLLTHEAQIRLNPIVNELLGSQYLQAYSNLMNSFQPQYVQDFTLPVLAMWELYETYLRNPISLGSMLSFIDYVAENDVRPEFFDV